MLVGRAYEARSFRERAAAVGAFGSLALLPDLDVAGVALGLADHGIYGHRGYSHSLLFAGVVALAAGLVARRWGTRPAFTGLLAFVAIVSHGLLDAMTYRTRGIPFFWPISELRVTFPWRPIPPAPRGGELFSARGLQVLAIELIYFAPVVLLTFAPAFERLHALWRRLVGSGRRITPPAHVPAAAVRPRFTSRRAAFQVAGILAVVTLCVITAELWLRHCRVVAWIEHSTHESLAVSMAHRVPRHLH
jgi:inner membrane protein